MIQVFDKGMVFSVVNYVFQISLGNAFYLLDYITSQTEYFNFDRVLVIFILDTFKQKLKRAKLKFFTDTIITLWIHQWDLKTKCFNKYNVIHYIKNNQYKNV